MDEWRGRFHDVDAHSTRHVTELIAATVDLPDAVVVRIICLWETVKQDMPDREAAAGQIRLLDDEMHPEGEDGRSKTRTEANLRA